MKSPSPSSDRRTELRSVNPIAALPVRDRLKVHEIFYSIQGESTFAGRPCVLVRLTGCQMRCSWCDTEYAFHEGSWMTREQVLEQVAAFDCPLVELTGGEPLLQPAAFQLLHDFCEAGYEVLVETGGGVDITPTDPRVRRILDVKCPASGESEANHWPNLDTLRSTDEVKFVVADRQDFDFACDVVKRYALAERCPVHVSPVHGSVDLQELAEWILQARLGVRLQLQMHKFVWSPETRGV